MSDDEHEVSLLDFLSEQEIDIINYLRGYTEEGDAIPNGWRIAVEKLGGRWRVEQRHGFSGPTLIGESAIDFSDAWIDQAGGDLRYVEPPSDPAIEPEATVPTQRPRLTVIKGRCRLASPAASVAGRFIVTCQI